MKVVQYASSPWSLERELFGHVVDEGDAIRYDTSPWQFTGYTASASCPATLKFCCLVCAVVSKV